MNFSVLANYLIWRLVFSSLDYLPIEMKQRKNRFINEITIGEKTVPRWKECIELTASQLNPAASALYIRKNIIFGTKNDTKSMANFIIERFRTVINSNDWMEPQVHAKALQKLNSLIIFNGFPEEHRTDESIAKYYADLVIDDKEFFKTVFRTDHFIFRKKILKYKKSVEKENWENWANALFVDVTYDFDENSIRKGLKIN